MGDHQLQVLPHLCGRGPRAAGPLAGTPWPTSARLHVTFKSPLTGAYGYANSGGYFAAEMRHAGYDVILITGRAPEPVVLRIEDEEVEAEVLARHGYVSLEAEPSDAEQLKRQDSLKASDPLKSPGVPDTAEPLKELPVASDPADAQLDIDALLADITPRPPERCTGFLCRCCSAGYSR